MMLCTYVCVCVCVCAGTYDQSGEAVYSMSLCGDRLVVGTANRKVRVQLNNSYFDLCVYRFLYGI